MKIARIDAFPLRLTLRAPYPPNSFGQPHDHRTVIVVAESDDGVFGIGEAAPALPLELGLTWRYLADVINNYYGPALVGCDLRRINAMHELMDRQIWGAEGLEAARAGVDCAIHDLIGRTHDVSVAELMGGRIRDTFTAIGGVGIAAPEAMAREAAAFHESFPSKFLKVKIGGGRIRGTWPSKTNIALDIARLQHVRQAIPDDVVIIADANQAYTPSGAIKLGRACEVENLMLEQPVDENDLEGLARVARSLDIPIVADEAAYNPRRLLGLLKHAPVDAVNIKPSRAGGFHGTLRMIGMIEAAGMKCSLDCVLESRIAGAMIAQLASVVRDDAFMGTSATLISDFWVDDSAYWSGGTTIENGCFRLSPAAGLGLEVSPRFWEILDGQRRRPRANDVVEC